MPRPRDVRHLLPSRALRSQTPKLVAWTLLVSFLSPCIAATATGKKKPPKPAAKKAIQIVSPKARPIVASGGSISLQYKVEDSITSVKILITNGVDASSGPAGRSDARVLLYEGTNTIKLSGYKDSALAGQDTITVECNSECVTGAIPPGGMVQSTTAMIPPTPQGGGGSMTPAATPYVSLRVPPTVANVATVDTMLVVQDKSGISQLIVQVYNNGQGVDTKTVSKTDVIDGIWIATAKLKVTGGSNFITAIDPSHFNDPSYQASSTLTCNGACGGGGTGSQASTTSSTKNVTILQPTDDYKVKDVDAIDAYLTVLRDSKIKKLIYEIYDKDGKRGDPSDPIAIPDGTDKLAQLTTRIPIKAGANTIRFLDPDKLGDSTHEASVKVSCEGKCGEAAGAAAKPVITVDRPKDSGPVRSGSVDTYLTLTGKDIEQLQYEVFHDGRTIYTSDVIDVKTTDDKPREVRVDVKVVKGNNTVTFFNAANKKDLKQTATLAITCEGENCPLNLDIAQYPSSGQNSRVIVGLEQAGGSSAESKTNPVLDLFFMTPFIFDRSKNCGRQPATDEPYTVRKAFSDCKQENVERKLLPRLGFWGDIRLAATPEQIATAQVFPTSLVNQVDNSEHSVNLVQSFDFLAGLEGRVWKSNGHFLSLIPGMPQKTSFYIAGGYGAISPLNASRQVAQVFKIPAVGDPQREEFVARYGEPPAGKEFVGMVPLDRDRFFRQWYTGIRLKTLYCTDDDCTRYKNSFPAVVDFMFGQNESVTGGSRKRGGTPDPNNPNKLLGQSNSYVLRFDAFYPLPIKKANFLFLYGTALMKVGGGGVKITTPLFLDNPGTTVEITDPKVYIPALNLLKLQQPDRDYYKLGVGINLTDLFNRNKPKE